MLQQIDKKNRQEQNSILSTLFINVHDIMTLKEVYLLMCQTKCLNRLLNADLMYVS